MKFLTAKLLLFALAVWIALPPATFALSVIDSKHNLSATGPGTIKASTETEICIFCHTPHNSGPQTPLWNHQISSATYIPYSSTTLKATVGQPTGASKLCLSCHDGTVALGLTFSRTTPIGMQNGVTTMPSGESNLGTDLSHQHPVSFTYDSALVAANGQLKDPSTLTGKVRLDHAGQLQCTACHDPHDNRYGSFLVADNTASALCTVCHEVTGWSGSAHHTSTALLPTTLTSAKISTASKTATKAPISVAANGCANCHVSHNSPAKERLLKQTTEDKTCYTCHGGSQTAKNIAAEFNKLSAHPVLSSQQLHNPKEDPINAPRHTACGDCHNTHESNNKPTLGGRAGGAIQGTSGIAASGAVVTRISNEYELCFRCHGDNISRAPSRVPRALVEPNMRLKFTSANASFHSVISTGKNPLVPSLIPPLTASSTMKCTDCHNNDQGPGAGGNGPNGPHGSSFPPLLERPLAVVDFAPETSGAYALCYKCHSRSSILSDQSFKGHRKHIVDEKTACTTCHDSHGVGANKHLINFNLNYVKRSSNGRLDYVSTGPSRGNCSLTCHNKDHDALPYSPEMTESLPSFLKRKR